MGTLRQLIKGSMRLIRVVGANETPTDEDMDISKRSLAGLLDSMDTNLLNIYTTTPVIFILEPGVASYTLGPAVNSAGNPTNADWVTPRPMRVERGVLLQNASIQYAAPPAP